MNNKPPISQTTKIVIAIAFFLFSAYNIVLTALQDYILYVSGNASYLGISFGVFTLAAVLSRFISGWIIEHIDDIIALAFANAILTATLVLYPFATEIIPIYAIRATQGFGWALSTVTILTMIAENTESSRVSEAFGYLGGFGSFSLLIFPVLGSWLVEINTIAAFQLCFLLAFGLGVVSTMMSVYAWHRIPPTVSHSEPVAGLPDRAVIAPTLSALLLFVPLGVFLSYSPEIASSNGIQNSGMFFSIYAFAQILGSYLGGILTGSSRYGRIAVVGSLFAVFGILLMVALPGIIGYALSALAVGFGLAAANTSLNSHVSSVSKSSEAKGMAIYSAGVDTGIAIGSFGPALLLGFGWGIPMILLVFGFSAFLSSLNSYFFVRQR